MEDKKPKAEIGGSDVFIVDVKFRQNGTWQGTVKWNGQNQEVHFRSTLELLKIMDGAITEHYPDEA